MKLDATDLQVLEMIRVGHCYMADLTDALGVDSKTSSAAVEHLGSGAGYIVRAGMRGSKFYTFSITDKAAPPCPSLEAGRARWPGNA